MRAISGTSGSSGFGSHNREQMDKRTAEREKRESEQLWGLQRAPAFHTWLSDYESVWGTKTANKQANTSHYRQQLLWKCDVFIILISFASLFIIYFFFFSFLNFHCFSFGSCEPPYRHTCNDSKKTKKKRKKRKCICSGKCIYRSKAKVR